MSSPHSALRRKRQTELAQARKKLENIKSAIEQGVVTRTTKAMLEEAEHRVQELESTLVTPLAQRKVVHLPSIVDACLRDLKGSLETDPDAAQALLARLIGPITLRREGRRLMAETRGNLLGLLSIDDLKWETLVPEEGLEPPRA
ncbi:MAG TPA: hypothetical protein VJT32_12150 [bacterium]|nr:hypothetical protein [bacterium]